MVKSISNLIKIQHMKTFISIIIGLVVVILFFLFRRVLGRENISIEEHKENIKCCLTLENYVLIRESPYANELSEYTIYREEDELKFRGEAAFFTLTTHPPETNTVKLTDLSTHGLREREFLRYTCNLVDKIIEKNKQLKNKNNH